MSISKPQNREEFKKHILTKLGAPVLQINVADEQMDVAIDDAFQFFNERNHFNGVERMYLTTQINNTFAEHFKSYNVDWVDQDTDNKVWRAGMVREVQLVTPGSGYRYSTGYDPTATNSEEDIYLLTDTQESIQKDPGGEFLLLDDEDTGGRGLTLKIFPPRTTDMGILQVEVYNTGTGYEEGQYVTVMDGNRDAIVKITKVSDNAPIWGNQPVRRQNNWITLPDDVVGVTQVMKSTGSFGLGGGIIPPGSLFPMLMGGLTGDSCNESGFGLTTYYAMMQYMALIEFMFMPPRMYNFNQRTHRLHLDGDLGTVGQYLCLEVMIKPSPDVFPDLWNDMWLKDFAYSLVKAQWGRNLTKFNQVQMPGGITLNGEKILQDAQQELETIRQRFAMDWADPCLDAVG